MPSGPAAAGGGGSGGPRRPGAPSQGPAVRRPATGEILDQLGRDIKQLQVDFERFFNGALPIPPEELRNRIQNQLRQLRNVNLTSAVENFRMADIEARYNTYNELFNRRLRDREEGRHPTRAHVPEPPQVDLAKGILLSGKVDAVAAEALYQGLAKSEAPKFDLESFRVYLERQTAAIRARTGCEQVQFRLASEDGKLKLKARPVGEAGG